MAKQVINIGAAPNDGTGTPLRTSFDYTNQNFTELYNGSGIGTSTNTQVLFNDSGVANGDAGLVYNKTTDALSVGGNVVMSTAGKGIDFSATANSSGTMTSELLADYEEGTWVPTDASGASPALVFTPQFCTYTKIGRAVTVQGVITYPSTVTTNGARFTGLPFAFVGMAPFNISYAENVATTSNLAFIICHYSAGPLFYAMAGFQTQNTMLSGSTIWFNGTYYI
jgi:hypothetical protein